ncbi:beta strand repeat-containing protein [Jannaschia sp. KMU-145]|uniref:beta strand repeat-containing protein n=1 Tax=Jannaschia halovivens TaxID=3388667 RepID=UPI00396B2100
MTARPTYRIRIASLARGLTGLLSSSAIVVSSILPAWAQVELTEGAGGAGTSLTDTTISVDATDPTISTITTGSISNNVALNAFRRFDIGAGETVNLVQPDGTVALVNVVNDASGAASRIDGTLNTSKAGDAAGVNSSRVFMLDHNGFVVGGTGRINANTLIMSTATAAFGADVLSGSSDAMDTLMAGEEPLADADITFAPGSIVNVTALELNVGAALVLNGSVTVDAPDQEGSSVPVAVNTSGIPQATGARVEGGVIRFGAGSASVGGTIRAARGGRGGQINGAVTSSLAIRSGAVLDVSGMALDGGTILFGGAEDGDFVGAPDSVLTFEAGSTVDAASAGGSGGFLYVSGASVRFGATMDLGPAGGALLDGRDIAFAGTTTTGGGDLAALARGAIAVEANARIDTTSAMAGGDLSLIAPSIDVAAGAALDADVAGTDAGGLIAILADQTRAEIGLPVAETGATATIAVTGATLTGGAIVVSALAASSNSIDDATAAAVQGQIDQSEEDDGAITAAFALLSDGFDALARTGADAFGQLAPLQIRDLDANATIAITNSTLTARGNWSGAGLAAMAPDAVEGDIADNGVLRADGMQTRGYTALAGDPLSALTRLPNGFDPRTQSLYVHANAEVNVAIDPLALVLSAATSVTDVTATVRIDDSALTAISGDIALTSSVSEAVDIELVTAGLGGFAASTVVNTQNSHNQLLVRGGSITARDGNLRAAALTGKSREITNRVGAGNGGQGAVAVTVSLGSSFTEAAIGGQIAARDMSLMAETIRFETASETVSTLGGPDTAGSLATTSPAAAAGQVAAIAVRSRLQGEGSDEDATKNKLATSLAFDIQIDTAQTFATLGGSYRDPSGSGADVTLAAPTVDLSGALTLAATERFGRFDEGGAALNRTVRAQTQDVSSFISRLPGLGRGPEQGTDTVLVSAFSMSQMAGQVRAEIGTDATVTAADVTVDAVTQYQTTEQLTNFRQRWAVFMDELSTIDPGFVTGGTGDLPDLDDATDGLVFATTSTGSKSVQAASARNDQSYAMGANINVFETDNSTVARIADGARVTTASDVTVRARQEAVFTHMSAASEGGSKLAPSGTASNLIGATVSVPRMLSSVLAEVGSGTVITARDLNILAETDVIQIGVARAGGSAAKASINGSVAANLFETTTVARLGETARVTAREDIRIEAIDRSMLLSLAGTKSGSGSIAFGASGVANLVRRDTRAEIGRSDSAALQAATVDSVISARSLSLRAGNTGLVFGSALAGSKVAGSAAGSAAEGAEDNDQELAVPTAFLDADDAAAIEAQADNQTAPDAGGATGSAGWAVSGAVVLNLFGTNDALTSITTASRIELTEDLALLADNTALDIGLAGSVAYGLGLDLGASALAGAVAVKTDERDTRVELRGVTIDGRRVDAEARDAARSVNVAVGGAGGKNALVTLAGSVTTNFEGGETRVGLTDAVVTTQTTTSVLAANTGQQFGVAGAVSYGAGGMTSAGLGVAVNVSNRDALLDATRARLTGGALSLRSLTELEVYGVAAAAGLGKLSLAGAAVVNTVNGRAETRLTETDADGPAIAIASEAGNALWAYGGALSVGSTKALGMAITTNIQNGGAQTILRRSQVTGGGVEIGSLGAAALTARALGVSKSGTGAAGLAIAVNRTGMDVLTDLDGSRIVTSGNLAARSAARVTASGLALSAAIGGTAGINGTATYNDVANTVATRVRDSTGIGAPLLMARGSLALLSEAETGITLLGGGDSIPNANGTLSGGGTAGIGASITINRTHNSVTTEITDAAVVQAFGLAAHDLGARLGVRRGATFDAFADTEVEALAVSAAAAGNAALTGIFVYNTLSDDALVTLGDGRDVQLNLLATLDAAGASELGGTLDILGALGVAAGGTLATDAAQATRVAARVSNAADTFAVAAAVSGGASVGASGTGTLIDSTATVRVNTARIGASSAVDVNADVSSRLSVMSFGAAGGKAAGAASVAYSAIRSAALIDLAGARITSRGTAAVTATTASDITGLAGNVAGGGGAGAGSVLVNVLAASAEVRSRGTTELRYNLRDVVGPDGILGDIRPTYIPGVIAAEGDVEIAATVENVVTNTAISGAAGGGFVAFSSAIDLVESRALVDLGDAQTVTGSDVSIAATEQTRLTNDVGVLAAGGAGAGGSLEYVDFAGNASVLIGDEARLTARGSLDIDATADRQVTGQVGMASVGGGTLTAAISILNVGGLATEASGEGAALVGAATGALADDPTSGGGAGSLGGMSTRAGADGAASGVEADQATLAIGTSGRTDNVGVTIGANAILTATDRIDIAANIANGLSQRVGVVSASAASLSAAVGVTQLSSTATVAVGTGSEILSDGAIAIASTSGSRPGVNTVDATVFAAAASAFGNVGAGLVVVDVATRTGVDIADGVRIGNTAPTDYGAAITTSDPAAALQSSVAITSRRADTVAAEVTSIGLSATASIGAAIATANNRGTSGIEIGRGSGPEAVINSGAVTLAADDDSRVSATTQSAQGGTLAGMSGAISTAEARGATRIALTRATIDARTLDLRNTSAARSIATARGLSLGALAVGVTTAEARGDAVLTTTLSGVRIAAVDVEILTELSNARGTNVVADATAGAGGIVAGGGAVARALSNYTARTRVEDGDDPDRRTAILGVDRVLIETRAAGYGSQATASGITAGALAIGVVIAEAGQKGDGRRGRVLTEIDSGAISTFGTLYVASDNRQAVTVDVTSGSGGLAAGAGAEARTHVDTETRTTVGATRAGAAGRVVLTAGNPLDPESTRLNGGLSVRASEDVSLQSQLDNTSAALLGVSGAVATSRIASDVDVLIGGRTEAYANAFTIAATSKLTRPTGPYNIKSASGGGIALAAISSDIDAGFATDVTVEDAALMVQIGDPNRARSFFIGSETTLSIKDKLILDAGGALASPIGRSDVDVTQVGRVEIGAARLIASGDLEIYAGGSSDIRAEAHSTSYGLAGTASASTYATLNAINQVNIRPGADLLSYSDIVLRAGYGRSGAQEIDVNAEARSFNRTAIPINIDPIADATANLASEVNIGAAARVIAYQDITIDATAGERNVVGYGLGKDFYRELISDAASLAGVSLVLDIKRGTSTDTGRGTATVDGEVRAGAFARRILALNEADVLDNSQVETSLDSGIFERDADAPDPSLYRVERDVDLGALYTRRIAELQDLIDDPATSAADAARYTASQAVLLTRRAELAGQTSSVITVDYLRASEGSVRITGDFLTGGATGSLYAAGEADIRIQSTSGAQLNVSGLEITDVEGGEITFNQANIAAGSPLYDFDVGYGRLVDGANTIAVLTYEPSTGSPGPAAVGNVDVLGQLANYAGDVIINTELGSINQGAPITAEDVTLTAPFGSINVDPIPGVDNKGGAPTVTYRNLVNGAESYSDFLYDTFVVGFGRNVSRYDRTATIPVASFYTLPPLGFISAGRDLTLLAEYTNINTLIRAGTGAYVVDIGAGIDTVVANLRAQGGTGRVRLDSATSEFRPGVVRTDQISSNTNARIFYNYETDQIEIEDMRVRGGAIYITSSVVSTGSGVLEAVDGYGSLTLTSDAMTDVVLHSVDLGGSANGTALAGLVRITDLSKLSNLTVDGRRQFLTTDYRSVGGAISVYDNILAADGSGGLEEYTDPATQNKLLRPAREITASKIGAGGTLFYDPTRGQDYVAITEETYLVRMDQYDVAIVTGSWTPSRQLALSAWYRKALVPESDAGIVAGTSRDLASAQFDAPQIAPSVGNYAYRYDYTRQNTRLAPGARSYQVTLANGRRETIQIDPSLYAEIDASRDLPVTPVNKSGPSAGFTRDLNIYPGDQSYYALLYDIDPTLRAVEDELNGRHKIIDRRSALFFETERHEHRFKADYEIAVRFSGSQVADTSITTRGNVILSEDVSNRFSDTAITSRAGSILTAQPGVDLKVGNLSLSAGSGRIGGVRGAMRLDLTEGATLNASAANGIDLFQTTGDLRVGTISTTARGAAPFGAQVGAITLEAQGSILQADTTTARISGSDISLTARSGSIARAGATGPEALRIDTEEGRLDATAQGDVSIRDAAGDLGLGEVASITGAVTLDAAGGRLLDRNNVEQRDTRTLAQLNDLWSQELGLTAGTAAFDARRTAQIDALEQANTAAYRAYWARRTAAGGAGDLTFALDASVEAQMRAGTQGDAAVDAYIAGQQDLYDQWNADAAFDASYRYAASATEIAGVTGGNAWTIADLTSSIRRGLVLETGDTKVRIETPNVTAPGDIVLTARDGVGEIRDPYVIVKPVAGASLTEADIAALAVADKEDLGEDAAGNTTIRQEEDVNFAFVADPTGAITGTLTAESVANEIYLAAETAARIASIRGEAAVELRISGTMTQTGAVPISVIGRNVVLESGLDAGIGSASDPLSVGVLAGGGLTVRAGTDIFMRAPATAGLSGDIPIASAFAGGVLDLRADGAVTSSGTGADDRIIASDIVIAAASIGTAASPLGLRLADGSTGQVDLLSRTGGIDVFSTADLVLGRFDSAAGGGLALRRGADVALRGADVIRFAATDDLVLDVDGDLDVTAATGVAVAGGGLTLQSGGTVGGAALPLTTEVARLSYGPTVTAPADRALGLYLSNTGHLAIGSFASTDVAASEAVLSTTGTLSATRIESGGRVALSSGGAMILDRASVARIDLQTTDGDVDVTLADRDVTVERIALGGTGSALDLAVTAGDAHVAAGGIAADGAIALVADQDVTMAEGASISAATGPVSARVTGDLTVGRIATGNASTDALRLTVGGTLRPAGTGATAPALVANAAGAVTTLRLGASAATGASGLAVALDTLDAEVTAGDLHLYEADAITLRNLRTPGGQVDLFADGTVTVEAITAADGITLAAGGDLVGDTAVMDAPRTALFAFGGSFTDGADGAFRGDVTTGGDLTLYARDHVRYVEAAGPLDARYAVAQTGDLELTTADANAPLSVGLPGAGGTLTLSTAGDMTIDILGTGTLDLIDEDALALVYRGPNPYGTIEIPAPERLHLMARGPGATLTLGRAHIKGEADLQADAIRARIVDETPEDGVDLRLSGVGGVAATRVDLDVIATGPGARQGAATVSFGRFGTGTITTTGPSIAAEDVVIGTEAWFRQNGFDLFAKTRFDGIVPAADAQLLALEDVGGIRVPGRVTFTLEEGRRLESETLVVNRRLEDVAVDTARSYRGNVLSELVQTTGADNRASTARDGTSTRMLPLNFDLRFLGQPQGTARDDAVLRLPLVIARN